MPVKSNEKVLRSATEPNIKFDTYTRVTARTKGRSVLLVEQANGHFRVEWSENGEVKGREIIDNRMIANDTFTTKMRDIGLAEDNTVNKDPKLIKG